MDQPHKHPPPACRAKVQYAKERGKSAKLKATNKLSIQQVTGTFLYYVHAVDTIMLVAISVIASNHAAPTEEK